MAIAGVGASAFIHHGVTWCMKVDNMPSYRKEIKEILRKLMDQGWEIRIGKSYMCIPPNKAQKIVIIALTPSDDHAVKNITSYLRRSGANI